MKQLSRCITLLALTLALSGCGPGPAWKRFNDYATANLPEVDAGRIPMSTFFLGMLTRANDLPPSTQKAIEVATFSDLYNGALAYEAGKASKADFEVYRGRILTQRAALEAAAKAQRDARINQALMNLQQVGLGIAELGRPGATSPQNCTSVLSGNAVTTNCY